MPTSAVASILTEPLPEMTPGARAELRDAIARLTRGPGLVSRMAELVGTALGGVGRLVAGRLMGRALPTAMGLAPGLQDRMAGVAQAALARAFDIAVLGVAQRATPVVGQASKRTGGHRAKLLVAASGAAGGAAGLAGFAPDAAVSTLAIMRRIARIAHEEGEDLSQDGARRACLEVFALRSGVPGDNAGEPDAGYFPTRLLLQGGPLVRLLAEVAGRYGMQLGQKLAAQAVPVAGAVCGAAINTAFMAEYEGLARAHFTVRRLERIYGAAAVRTASEA